MSLIQDDGFVMEVVAPTVVVVGAMALAVGTIFIALTLAFGPPICNSFGSKTGAETSWSFWTGCYIRVHGTWLPKRTVVPILRDGVVVFEPKPVVLLKSAK